MGYFRTTLLFAGLTALFMGTGFLIGGPDGGMIALVVASVINLFTYWGSDRLLLSMYRAQEIDRAKAPRLYRLVAHLAARAGLPMPRVFLIDTAQPNAFATGRSPEHAAIAVTTGLMQQLNRQELSGVIAHELAHIKNRDTLLMTVAAVLTGAISSVGNFGMSAGEHDDSGVGFVVSIAVFLAAYLAAVLVQLAISRVREYAADNLGARICGDPMWLASALSRLERAAMQMKNPDAERHPATAHLFIVNPFAGKVMKSLFATHPATANRIAALRRLAAEMKAAPAAG